MRKQKNDTNVTSAKVGGYFESWRQSQASELYILHVSDLYILLHTFVTFYWYLKEGFPS